MPTGPVEFTPIQAWEATPDENNSYFIASPLNNTEVWAAVHQQSGTPLGRFSSFSEASNACFTHFQNQ